MTYEQLKHLKPSAFKRRCGVQPDTFEQMTSLLRPHLDRSGKRGGQAKLSVEDQLLLVLEYWREYRTQFHIGTSWGLSELRSADSFARSKRCSSTLDSLACQVKSSFAKMLSVGRCWWLMSPKARLNGQKNQRAYYSGKKKQHSLKAQVVVNQAAGQMICPAFMMSGCLSSTVSRCCRSSYA